MANVKDNAEIHGSVRLMNIVLREFVAWLNVEEEGIAICGI